MESTELEPITGTVLLILGGAVVAVPAVLAAAIVAGRWIEDVARARNARWNGV